MEYAVKVKNVEKGIGFAGVSPRHPRCCLATTLYGVSMSVNRSPKDSAIWRRRSDEVLMPRWLKQSGLAVDSRERLSLRRTQGAQYKNPGTRIWNLDGLQSEIQVLQVKFRIP